MCICNFGCGPRRYRFVVKSVHLVAKRLIYVKGNEHKDIACICIEIKEEI